MASFLIILVGVSIWNLDKNTSDAFHIQSRSSMSAKLLSSPSSSLQSIRSTSFLARTRKSTMIGRGDMLSGKNGKSPSSSSLNMIFERMSEDCISALVTAQNEAARLGQSKVGTEIMTVGIIDHPENARKVLQGYGMTLRKARSTVNEMFQNDEDDESSDSGANFGKMFNMNKKARDVELPFAPSLKRSLNNAARIADRFYNIDLNPDNKIRSEHVLLALMEYEEKEDGSISSASLDEGGYAKGALAVFLRTDGLKTNGVGGNKDTTRNADKNTDEGYSFSSSELCRALVNDIKNPSNRNNNNNNNKELVGGGSSSSSTPTLSEIGVDLTDLATKGELDEVYGRDEEILSCLRTLVRRRKNNPCLNGDPGVGKTAIAEGIAQILAAPAALERADELFDRDEDGLFVNQPFVDRLKLLAQQCPPRLKDHRVISLELANLVAGTKYRGEFEERLQAIVNEVTDENAPPTILFIDEIHTLVGAGSAEGGIDAANMLKPALARGKLQVIGATTTAEYRKYIEKDAALERRLQPITVKEPSIERTIGILEAVAPRYEKHHDVRYTPESLEAAAKLSDRYISDRFLPDKALDLLDEAGAMIHMEHAFANAASTTSFQSLDNAINKELPEVTDKTIASVVSEWSSVPVGKIESEESQRLIQLEDELEVRVKGQSRAVRAVSRAVRRARSGLRDTSRPVASFMFCGPTGVGKTELCKTLATTYYGSEKDMVRIDMSEYMEKHAVSRLTGPPPGYIGYEEGGQLTEAVRKSPHSLVLLDELEKAHSDVLNILLQILEDGMLTDGKGRTVNFKNAILVMTSNVGSKRILDVFNKHNNNDNTVTNSAVNANGASLSAPKAIDPLRPDEVMTRLQKSPQAMSMMMEAAADPDIMSAMQTAMGGSPADLLRLGRENPKVADFLTRLWGVLNDTEGDDSIISSPIGGVGGNGASNIPQSIPSKTNGGMGGFGEAFTENEFVSGLFKQFQNIVPSLKEDDKNEQSNIINSPPSSTTNFVSTQQDVNDQYAEMSSVVKEELESSMKPELLNRIDEIIIFSPLGNSELFSVASLLLQETISRAEKERGIFLSATDALIMKVLEEGSANAAQFGARPMRRAVQRFFEDTVGDAIIRGFIREGDNATIDIDNLNENTYGYDGGEYSMSSVRITRHADSATMTMEVENGDGGIGGSAASVSASSYSSGVNGDSLQTEAVRG